jgi:hypothetical protein
VVHARNAAGALGDVVAAIVRIRVL